MTIGEEMTGINPYLQATANCAHDAAKAGENAAIDGFLDKFIESLAKFIAWTSHTSGINWMDYIMYDSLTVHEFEVMCLAYGIYEVHLGPNARDWFVTNYKTEYNKFEGWE